MTDEVVEQSLINAMAKVELPGDIPVQDRYFELEPGQTLNDVDLGFLARTLIVDNPTAQWWFVPAVYSYVPPYSFGITIPMPVGTQVARVLPQSPSGVNVSDNLTGQRATFRFLSTYLQYPSPGVQTPAQPPSALYNGVLGSGQNIPLPVNRTLLGLFLLVKDITGAGTCSLSITEAGATYVPIGLTYFVPDVTIFEGAIPINIPLRPGATIRLITSGGFGANVLLLGSESEFGKPTHRQNAAASIPAGTGNIINTHHLDDLHIHYTNGTGGSVTVVIEEAFGVAWHQAVSTFVSAGASVHYHFNRNATGGASHPLGSAVRISHNNAAAQIFRMWGSS